MFSDALTFPGRGAEMLHANAMFSLEMQAALCRTILGVQTLNPKPLTLNPKP